MQYINHWPDITELALPEEVSEGEAKEFWDETFSTVIILNPSDNITALKESDVWNEIDFALTYTEYSVPLSMNYRLLVTIVYDSGSGLFLVIPPEVSHIILEMDPHE